MGFLSKMFEEFGKLKPLEPSCKTLQNRLKEDYNCKPKTFEAGPWLLEPLVQRINEAKRGETFVSPLIQASRLRLVDPLARFSGPSGENSRVVVLGF